MKNLLKRKEEFTHSRYFKWVACGTFGIGLAYSISACFLGLFYYSNIEIIVLLTALSFTFSTILLLIPKFYFSRIIFFLGKFSNKQILFAAIILTGISIMAFFVSLSFLPTLNTFQLSILENEQDPDKSREISVLQIEKIGKNGILNEVISPYTVKLVGNWVIEKNSLSISGNGTESIVFAENSNNGISLLLLKAPQGGKILVNWNGASQIIDLQNDTFDQIRVDFPHFYSWKHQSTIRNILVFTLIFSNIISFVFLLIFSWYVYLLTQGAIKIFTTLPLLQKVIVFLILITPIINIIAFSNFQSTDESKMGKIPSNSLIRWDKLE